MIQLLHHPMMYCKQRRSGRTSSRKWIEYGKVFRVHQIQTMPSDGGSFNSFTPVTVEENERIIAAEPNEHCLLNSIPTALIKNCAALLALFLSQMFNRFLSEGYISASQKVAVVKPLLKMKSRQGGPKERQARVKFNLSIETFEADN